MTQLITDPQPSGMFYEISKSLKIIGLKGSCKGIRRIHGISECLTDGLGKTVVSAEIAPAEQQTGVKAVKDFASIWLQLSISSRYLNMTQMSQSSSFCCTCAAQCPLMAPWIYSMSCCLLPSSEISSHNESVWAGSKVGPFWHCR